MPTVQPFHRLFAGLLLGLSLLQPELALAHGFGRTYMIPVPVWMYLYGAVAALGLSFLLIAWFATSAEEHGTGGEIRLQGAAWKNGLRWARWALQGLSLVLFVTALAAALFGTRNPYMNLAMTWFWVLFVLGLGYASVLFGNLYRWLSPWAILVQGLGRICRRYPQGIWTYPSSWGYWPALVLYMAFIWVELEAELDVRGLGWLLLGYTGLNLVGVGLMGARDWFRYGEFFALFLRLFASMSPVVLEGRGRLRLRAPFAGLVGWKAEGYSMLLFILFMLSSTAYDGLRITVPWTQLFWVELYGWLQPWVGSEPIQAYHRMKPLHALWSSTALLLSPLVYLGVYLFFVAAMQAITRSPLGLRELAFRFGPSLLPIALVYHAAHYYTLFLTQGIKIGALVSDPFGWGWNLFGTAHWLRANWILDAAVVWHTQLALIVGGHIISVYIAHLVAFEVFKDRRQAALSQLPMLLLMMAFTAAGLWILAQPIAGP
ncbi:MAG: hypothetical protein ACPHCJ_04440 [Oceanococcaceae bacterium]